MTPKKCKQQSLRVATFLFLLVVLLGLPSANGETDLPVWLTITRSTEVPHWALTDAWYRDPQHSDMTTNIYVWGYRDGKPAEGALARQSWPGDGVNQPLRFRPEWGKAETDFMMSADSSFAPDRLEVGPYCIRMVPEPSDEICGLGLPLRHHVNYDAVFVWQASPPVTVSPPPPPVTRTPTATPTPIASLADAVAYEAGKIDRMAINVDAALYREAQLRGLGYPQSDEFYFRWNGRPYVAQWFVWGLVWSEVGYWNKIEYRAKYQGE